MPDCGPGWYRVYAGQDIYCTGHGCPQHTGATCTGCTAIQAEASDVYYVFRADGSLCDVEKYFCCCVTSHYCCYC